jgi:hypothetical protein
MRIIVVFLFVFSAWLWSDWKNWRKYYPTMLFMTTVSLLENIITANHKLWMMVNSPFITSSLANGLFVTFVSFPAVLLLYLSHYPQKKSRKVCYVLLWASFYSMIEYGMGCLGFYAYANGWSLGWSVMINVCMFPILRIHYQKPLLAWLCSGILILFVWFNFGFSLELFKDKL